jgi:hypothetical protein
LIITSQSSETEKLVFDAPLIVTDQGENSLKFSDLFGSELPYKIEIFNAHGVDNEVEILIGLTLD